MLEEMVGDGATLGAPAIVEKLVGSIWTVAWKGYLSHVFGLLLMKYHKGRIVPNFKIT